MKIIPVIDVMNGVTVHAIAGKRDEYKPLKSVICDTCDPVEVALQFKLRFGFKDLYVADLDSILGGATNFELYRQIKGKTGMELMVDAGITDFRKVIECGVSYIVIGTESIPSFDFLKGLAESIRDRLIVSLDLEWGKIRATSTEIMKMDPVSFAKELQKLGIKSIILLDLKRVGTEVGIDLKLVNDVINNVKVKVFVGGGIRNIQDLRELEKMGADGVLVATAIHKGIIKPEDLRTLRSSNY